MSKLRLCQHNWPHGVSECVRCAASTHPGPSSTTQLVTLWANSAATTQNQQNPPKRSFPKWNFNTASLYDASKDISSSYNFKKIIGDQKNPGDIRRMWADYGETFKEVGRQCDADPYALAACCVFESYDSNMHTYYVYMNDPKVGFGLLTAGKIDGLSVDKSRRVVGAGIAATQVKDLIETKGPRKGKGKAIPGLPGQYFPDTREGIVKALYKHPEYGIRWLAYEFHEAYKRFGDLNRAFTYVADPYWKGLPNADYGTKTQYVSRAWALYKAFAAENGNKD